MVFSPLTVTMMNLSFVSLVPLIKSALGELTFLDLK